MTIALQETITSDKAKVRNTNKDYKLENLRNPKYTIECPKELLTNHEASLLQVKVSDSALKADTKNIEAFEKKNLVDILLHSNLFHSESNTIFLL